MRHPRFNSQTRVLLDVGATKHASTHRHTYRPVHMRQYTHRFIGYVSVFWYAVIDGSILR